MYLELIIFRYLYFKNRQKYWARKVFFFSFFKQCIVVCTMFYGGCYLNELPHCCMLFCFIASISNLPVYFVMSPGLMLTLRLWLYHIQSISWLTVYFPDFFAIQIVLMYTADIVVLLFNVSCFSWKLLFQQFLTLIQVWPLSWTTTFCWGKNANYFQLSSSVLKNQSHRDKSMQMGEVFQCHATQFSVFSKNPPVASPSTLTLGLCLWPWHQ